MFTGNFSYEAPLSVEAAIHLLAAEEDVMLVAGGTDLVPLIKSGVKNPSRVLSLKNISRLKSIEPRSDGIFIGSTATLSEVAAHPLINERLPALGHSARSVASPQIRNVATIGGNLLQERRCLYYNQSRHWRRNVPACFKLGGKVCHQVPKSTVCRALYYSDTASVLLAFGARAEFYDHGVLRVAPLGEMIHGRVTGGNGKLLLTGIFLPALPEGTWGEFTKYSVRAAVDFATANMALRFSPALSGKQQTPTVEIFVGAISSEPVRLNETAEYLASNFSQLSSLPADVTERALSEVSAKCALIRETGVSLGSKRNALNIVSQGIMGLSTFLSIAESPLK